MKESCYLNERTYKSSADAAFMYQLTQKVTEIYRTHIKIFSCFESENMRTQSLRCDVFLHSRSRKGKEAPKNSSKLTQFWRLYQTVGEV